MSRQAAAGAAGLVLGFVACDLFVRLLAPVPAPSSATPPGVTRRPPPTRRGAWPPLKPSATPQGAPVAGSGEPYEDRAWAHMVPPEMAAWERAEEDKATASYCPTLAFESTDARRAAAQSLRTEQ